MYPRPYLRRFMQGSVMLKYPAAEGDESIVTVTPMQHGRRAAEATGGESGREAVQIVLQRRGQRDERRERAQRGGGQ